MTSTTPFTLPTPSGATLDGLLDLPDPRHHSGPRPAVVVCHGFKGFMEWGFFPHLGTLLAERGIVAVRFNLSGSGMRPGEDRVGDPDAFRADTHSLEVEDLLTVLAATGTDIAAGQVDLARLGVFGHSRGGGNAILASAREPWRDRLRALVTWASVAAFDRYSPDQKEAWRRDGELPVVNARTGQQLALGLGLLEDLEAHRAELDLLAAAAHRRAPWLIVHGSKDESVPAVEGERLASLSSHGAAPPAELLTIPEADHTFGSRHPFAGPSPWLVQALNATQRWFLRHL
ncbi:MAG TPA: prolyl oligopeptidase family serine peptidase [Thermoanaerobaculia bacterium]|nr:prolyl oligopeptidase family serine peptidase [Thermoanaerobaculia bacterium]